MKKFTSQTKIFLAGFCSAACIVAVFLTLQPKPASGDNDAVLQELKALREEVTGFRQDFQGFLNLLGAGPAQKGATSNNVPATDQDSVEASNIVSDLRNLKAAALMFYADNLEKGDANLEKLINADDSATSLLAVYTDHPEKFGAEYRFKVVASGSKKLWVVGMDIAQKPEGVKNKLQDRAKTVGLLSEAMELYTGGNWVFMVAR